MIETYNFTGNAVTILGAIGVVSTAIIMMTAFKYRARIDLASVKRQDDSNNYDTYGK